MPKPPRKSPVFVVVGLLYLVTNVASGDETTASPSTISQFGNLSLPILQTSGPFGNIPTLPPFDLASLTNFTLPTFAPLGNFTLPDLSSFTLPPLGNFTFPTFGTFPPLGNFTFPTFAPLADLISNVTHPPAIAPAPNGSATTHAPAGNFTMPTFAPMGNFTMPTFGTLPPLGNFTFGTLPPLGNFTLPTFGTLPPLGNFTFGTLPPLGNFTMPTFAPLGNFTFGTLPPLGNFTFGTLPPLGNFTLPTLPPLGNFTFGTLPPLGNFTFGTIPPLGNFTFATIPPLGNFTLLPTMANVVNVTLPPTTTGHAMNVTMAAGTTTTGHALNVTMAAETTTMGHALNVTMAATTTKSGGAMTPCGTSSCTSSQACAAPLNSSQVCVNRMPDKTYCVDQPCPTGMKCFDNITSNAYTCYMKLDGSTGECLGVKCSPGDICYQIEKQPAKCISIVQAPKCLGQNEEFSACKSGCESTCLTPTPACMNSTTCTPGCACIRGYVRQNGQCQLMSMCESTTTGNVTCSGTEEYTACKPQCEKTCNGVPSESCMTSTTTPAPTSCKPGCACREAYKRDSKSGQCVHARQCYSATTCGANETWSKCRNCEPVCGQTKNPSCKSCWSGCACVQGYSRNQWGSCVMTAQCIV